MEVTCEHCKARLNIPDEKIPRDQAVRVSCPKCKKKIVLPERTTDPKAPSSGESNGLTDTGRFRLRFIESKAEKEPKGASYSYEDYSSDESLDFFEEGTKLSLIMADNSARGEKIRTAVAELGYKQVSTENTRDAIGKLRFHHFDMILLCEGFEGQPLEQSQIVNFMNRLPMSVRRRIFLALVADKFKTMDNVMAFAMSANVVINARDVDKLQLILKKAISENEKFYKVFTDSLVETGKG